MFHLCFTSYHIFRPLLTIDPVQGLVKSFSTPEYCGVTEVSTGTKTHVELYLKNIILNLVLILNLNTYRVVL